MKFLKKSFFYFYFFGEIGILGVKFSCFCGLDVGFWAKNGVAYVGMGSLNKTGKARTFENVRKITKNRRRRLKIFENVWKMSWNVWKYLTFFHPPAHLIDYWLLERPRKINHRFRGLHGFILATKRHKDRREFRSQKSENSRGTKAQRKLAYSG